jgi:phage portal protein BeeE
MAGRRARKAMNQRAKDLGIDVSRDGAKSTTYTITIGADGFIPATSWTDTELDRLIAGSTTAYAAISGNSTAMAALPPLVQRRGGQGEGRWVEDPDHELNQLLKAPFGVNGTNPRWSWSQLLQTVAMHRYLVGNAYLKPAVVGGRRAKKLKALYLLLNPSGMKGIEDPSGVPTAYQYGSGAGVVEYQPDEIVNVMAPSVSSFWKGLAPVSVALSAMDVDYIAAQRQRYNLKNVVAPGLIVTIDGAFGVTQDQRDEITSYLTTNYQDAIDHGKPWVIGGGTKVEKPHDSMELAVFDTRRYARDEILMVIGMPPPIAGIFDRATWDNISRAQQIWWSRFLIPVLDSIYSAINMQAVAPIYGPDVRLWYDMAGADTTIGLMSARVELAQRIRDLGYPPEIAANHAGLDLPRVPGLDRPNAQDITAGRLPPVEVETDDAS